MKTIRNNVNGCPIFDRMPYTIHDDNGWKDVLLTKTQFEQYIANGYEFKKVYREI